jgi:hypothetical protein
MMQKKNIITRIVACTFPNPVPYDLKTGKNRSFDILISADGMIPFPQVIIRGNGQEFIVKNEMITLAGTANYAACVPENLMPFGRYQIQAEGCIKADISTAGVDDWIKWFGELTVGSESKDIETRYVKVSPDIPPYELKKQAGGVKIYFSIHKHMHQPYYQASDPGYWDGEKDSIFCNRTGPYTGYIPGAVWQYINGGLAHAGLSTSWSGSLIEQLDRCEREGLCGGAFSGWKKSLLEITGQKTAFGNQRVAFTAFGFFHPLMPLVPEQDIVRQIEWHRTIIKRTFTVNPVDTLFPPETAFHVRMIPALLKAGIKNVIYDSIHRFRACKAYPYAGLTEGMLPPNPAEQENPEVKDWMQMQNIWAGSKISPSLLKPEYAKYEDIDGSIHKIVVVPAERYIGNEDARGGFGALQYPSVLGQVYENIVQHNSFDPAHPAFFVLHSDGDNYGGGADSYYLHNTGRLVEWIKEDPRFELTTIDDYLHRFPPDPSRTVHIEPGSWSGADNGDPQFRKWFSRYDQPYSPDLNSWAVLTALQNMLHTFDKAKIKDESFARAERLMLTAETSCYWYWTGQDIWDTQVTNAANAAHECLKSSLDALVNAGKDNTGPTIFTPWVTPENPGGKTWGQGSLRDADKTGNVHTFIADVSGIKNAWLVLRKKTQETKIPMTNHGPYPSRTNATVTAGYYTAELPPGAGDVRFYIEAIDMKGNWSYSSLERIFLNS